MPDPDRLRMVSLWWLVKTAGEECDCETDFECSACRVLARIDMDKIKSAIHQGDGLYKLEHIEEPTK